jgi:hypothetical protein
VTSVRTGHVPGTHELSFDGPFEQIRLTHTARDRRVFADGASMRRNGFAAAVACSPCVTYSISERRPPDAQSFDRLRDRARDPVHRAGSSR